MVARLIGGRLHGRQRAPAGAPVFCLTDSDNKLFSQSRDGTEPEPFSLVSRIESKRTKFTHAQAVCLSCCLQCPKGIELREIWTSEKCRSKQATCGDYELRKFHHKSKPFRLVRADRCSGWLREAQILGLKCKSVIKVQQNMNHKNINHQNKMCVLGLCFLIVWKVGCDIPLWKFWQNIGATPSP